MRITRAAKVAAFPLIVLALVALVACQGACRQAPRVPEGRQGRRYGPALGFRTGGTASVPRDTTWTETAR